MENKKEVDEWAIKAIKILKQQGYLEKTNKPLFLIGLSIIIFGMIVGGSVIYAMNHDAFKSDISQNVTCPQAPACNCPIVNIPACPSQVCNNTCVYPNNLSIKLTNSS